MGRAQSAQSTADDVDFDFGANAEGAGSETGLHGDFLYFHRHNPDVYIRLVELARKAKAAGKVKCGIGMLFEVARWDFWLTTEKQGGWKMNNSHRSRYARLIMQQEQDLRGFFQVRELRS